MRKFLVLIAAVATAALSWLVLAPGSSAVVTSPSNCSGSYSDATFTTIIVAPYSTCSIYDSTVIGAVIVNQNASFYTCNSTIGGSVTATQAYLNIDNGTSINGAITLTKPGSSQVVGEGTCNERGTSEYSSILCPWHVGGAITVQYGLRYSNPVSIGDCGDMSIGGSVSILHNRLLVELYDANIAGSLICIDNWPPPDAAFNYVAGARVGCAILV
jgi:hypothetical protein